MAEPRTPVDLNYKMNQPDIYHDFGGRVPPNAGIAALSKIGEALMAEDEARARAAEKAGPLGGIQGFWEEFTSAVQQDQWAADEVGKTRSRDALSAFEKADFTTDEGVTQFADELTTIRDSVDMSATERMTRQRQVLSKYVAMYPELEGALHREARALGMKGFTPELNAEAKKMITEWQGIQKSAMETGVSVNELLRTKQEEFRANAAIKQVELAQANGKREAAQLLSFATNRPQADMYGLRNGNESINGIATPNLARVMKSAGAPLTGPGSVEVFRQAKAELHMLKLKARQALSSQFVQLSKDNKLLSDKAQEDIMNELEDGYRTWDTILDSKDPVAILNALNSYNEGVEKDHMFKIYGPIRRIFPGRTDQEINAMLWDHNRVLRDLEDGFTEADQAQMRDWQSVGTPSQKRYADQILGYMRLTPMERRELATGWLTKALTDPTYMGSDSPVENRQGAAATASHYAREVKNPTTRESPGIQNVLSLMTDMPQHPMILGIADNREAARSFWTTSGFAHDNARIKMAQRLAVAIENANSYAAANITDINGMSMKPGSLTVNEKGYATWSSSAGLMDSPTLQPILDDINAMLKLYRNGNPGEYNRIVDGLRMGQNYLLAKDQPEASAKVSEAEAAFGVR
jgi:hypothetical protein